MILLIEFQENAGDGRRVEGGGGADGYSAKRSSDAEVANPEVQVRDLVRVMGIVTPFARRGGGSFYRDPDPVGKWDLCRVPQAAVRHGRARQSSGMGPCVEGSCKYRACGSVFGENSFYRETRGTRLGVGGGRHVSKRSSDPRVVNPVVKIQIRDLVRVVGIVGIVAPFAPQGVHIRGKFV